MHVTAGQKFGLELNYYFDPKVYVEVVMNNFSAPVSVAISEPHIVSLTGMNILLIFFVYNSRFRNKTIAT